MKAKPPTPLIPHKALIHRHTCAHLCFLQHALRGSTEREALYQRKRHASGHRAAAEWHPIHPRGERSAIIPPRIHTRLHHVRRPRRHTRACAHSRLRFPDITDTRDGAKYLKRILYTCIYVFMCTHYYRCYYSCCYYISSGTDGMVCSLLP